MRTNDTSHQAPSGRHGQASRSFWKVLPLPLSLSSVLPTLDLDFFSIKRGVGSEDLRGPSQPTTCVTGPSGVHTSQDDQR